MGTNYLAILGVTTMTTVMSCSSAKKEYASYELYPVRSGNLVEMEYAPGATRFTLWAPTADEVRLMLYDAGEGGHAYETEKMEPAEDGTWTVTVDKDLLGKFYTFNVKYAKEPLMLNIEMADFIHDGEAVNRPNNAQEIYLKELGKESPMLVHLIMKSIHKENKRKVKHIGSKRFGIQYLLKGIYVHSDLLYFHTEIKNQSNVPFDVDYITFKVVDKKVAKRTAIQEQVLLPVRAYNYVVRVAGKKTEQTVFCLPKFTIPDDKELVVEMNEKEGGRHQSFVVENSDLVRALTINELSVK